MSRRMKKLTEFDRGYIAACANLQNLHDQPCIAADVLSQLGVHWKQIEAGGLSDYDMAALKEIRAMDRKAFLDGRTKAGRRALEGQP